MTGLAQMSCESMEHLEHGNFSVLNFPPLWLSLRMGVNILECEIEQSPQDIISSSVSVKILFLMGQPIAGYPRKREEDTTQRTEEAQNGQQGQRKKQCENRDFLMTGRLGRSSVQKINVKRKETGSSFHSVTRS